VDRKASGRLHVELPGLNLAGMQRDPVGQFQFDPLDAFGGRYADALTPKFLCYRILRCSSD
jgi:hypothetical protein